MSVAPAPPAAGMMPRFVAGVSQGPVKSICRAAWGGLLDGVSKVDSTNRPNGFARVPVLKRKALDIALRLLLARHSVLNTFVEGREGDPWLIPCSVEPEVTFLDVSGGVGDADRDKAEAAISALVWAPLNVRAGPLYRAYAVQFGRAESYIGLVSHHFVSDAISIQILMNDFVRLYMQVLAGKTPDLPPAGVSYQDYLHAIVAWVESDAGRQARADALERVASVSTPAFGDQVDPEDAEEEIFQLERAVVDRARRAARSLGVSVFTTLLAAQNVMLREFTADDKVTIKVITTGREASVLLNTVGNMADRIYVTTDLSGDPDAPELVARTHKALSRSRKQAFVRSDFLLADLADLGLSASAPVFNFMTAPGRPKAAADPAAEPRRRALRVPPAPGVVRTRPSDAYYLVMTDNGEEMVGRVRYGAGKIRGFVSRLEDALGRISP